MKNFVSLYECVNGNYDKRPNEFLSFLHILFIVYIQSLPLLLLTLDKNCAGRQKVLQRKNRIICVIILSSVMVSQMFLVYTHLTLQYSSVASCRGGVVNILPQV